MVDYEKAERSVVALKAADGDMIILAEDERLNLLELIYEFCEQQGWSKEDMEALGNR